MAPALLFITCVLAGLIAGFILSRLSSKGRSSGGSGEARLLEERLLKADQGLEKFSRQLAAQSSEIDLSDQIDEVVREIQAGEWPLPRHQKLKKCSLSDTDCCSSHLVVRT